MCTPVISKVLLTGFGPFPGVDINPSQKLVEFLSQGEFSGVQVESLVLKTAYHACEEAFAKKVKTFSPQAIISFGVSRNAASIQLERIGLNMDDSSRADISGEVRRDCPIHPQGPAGLWSTLDLEKIFWALKKKNFPVSLSHSAGTYLCNHLFFWGLYFLQNHNLPVSMGFIHIPSTEIPGGKWDESRLHEAGKLIVATVAKSLEPSS